ncbi:MAG: hypothetical protein KatS3mg082_1407 [Nitrospiraceae bacterium]|nr:MAG: hypothetical protein KatS3mg082_1407 [Nitrospiraceae bacterium]
MRRWDPTKFFGDNRVPVFAYGSNRAPAQVRFKMRQRGIAGSIYLVPCRLTGYRITFSNHVAPRGYVPFNIWKTDCACSATGAIMLLEAGQLEKMDSTETNYNRQALMLADRIVGLPPPILDFLKRTQCWLYVSKHGHLCGRDGRPFLAKEATKQTCRVCEEMSTGTMTQREAKRILTA